MQICYQDYQHEWKANVDNMIYSLQIDTLLATSTEIRTETLKDKTLVNVLSHLQNGKWPDKT